MNMLVCSHASLPLPRTTQTSRCRPGHWPPLPLRSDRPREQQPSPGCPTGDKPEAELARMARPGSWPLVPSATVATSSPSTRRVCLPTQRLGHRRRPCAASLVRCGHQITRPAGRRSARQSRRRDGASGETRGSCPRGVWPRLVFGRVSVEDGARVAGGCPIWTARRRGVRVDHVVSRRPSRCLVGVD